MFDDDDDDDDVEAPLVPRRPRHGAEPVDPRELAPWSEARDGSAEAAVARTLHPRLQLAAPDNPRLQWLRTLLGVFRQLEESPQRRFVVVFPTARSMEIVVVLEVEGDIRVCPPQVPHSKDGGSAPFVAVRYASQKASDDAAVGERIQKAFKLGAGDVEVLVAHSRAELEYARRVLREAAARRAGYAPSGDATPSYIVPPARDELPGDVFPGLKVELRNMSNPAYNGLPGIVVRPLSDGAWAVMPTDVRRALGLRAFARAAKMGEKPTKVDSVHNKDPLKPLAVFPRNLKPVVDADRPPDADV